MYRTRFALHPLAPWLPFFFLMLILDETFDMSTFRPRFPHGYCCCNVWRLLHQGVPTWTWVNIIRPYELTVGFILTFYGAQLRGGARILMYCQIRDREFLAIEAKSG